MNVDLFLYFVFLKRILVTWIIGFGIVIISSSMFTTLPGWYWKTTKKFLHWLFMLTTAPIRWAWRGHKKLIVGIIVGIIIGVYVIATRIQVVNN